MATNDVRVLKIDTNTAQTSVKELRNELKELKNTMLSCEQGTEEYNSALAQAAKIQHTLKEQMEQVNATAMDFGQIAQNCTNAVGGMVAGFQAAKAAMNLFGIENEDVLESLKKMQSLMAITQALPSIDKGIKAFKNLGIAIKGASSAMKGLSAAAISTGIGALIAALGLLIVNWDKVTESMKNWGIISNTTEEKLKEQEDRVKGLNDELKKLEGTYDKQVKDNKIKKLNSESKKSYEDLENQIKDYQAQLDIVVKKQEIAGNNRSEWQRLQDEGKALKENIHDLKEKQDAILANAESYKEVDKVAQTALEKEKKTVKELQVLLWDITQRLAPQSLQDELNAKFEGQPLKVPVQIEIAEEEDEDTKGLAAADALREKIQNTVKSLQSAFGLSEEEQYKQELNALDVALKTKLIKEEEYYKLRDALNKEQTQREMTRYAMAAGYVGDIFSSLGELMEEGSEEQKAFQIMGATVNMLGGITAAISGAFTTHSGPWDIALAVLQAAAIATSGAINIAKMSKTNEKNAKSMASSSAAASSAIQSIAAPVQYTQDVQGASIEGAIKDTKVYVTETDISNTQNRVRVTESEATF